MTLESQPEFFDEDDYDPKHPYKPTSAFDLSEQNVNNYFEYYYSLHREILDNKRPKRILCFKPNASGLGNKLLGFYTSFLLAMMTDRAFASIFLLSHRPATLVCDWPTFYDYFEMKIPVPHFKERIFSFPLPYASRPTEERNETGLRPVLRPQARVQDRVF